MEREPRPGEFEKLRASINALAIRRRLGRRDWGPPQPWGEGWMFQCSDKRLLIVTAWPHDLDTEYDYGSDWIHASISRQPMPTYDDLKLMHRAVFDGGHAYQVFVPSDEHINITENVLHLWGRADGKPVLPDFGEVPTDMKPTDVKLHRADGTVINCELVHDGPNESGVDMWLIVGVVYRPGDRLTVGVLPGRTGIDFAAQPF